MDTTWVMFALLAFALLVALLAYLDEVFLWVSNRTRLRVEVQLERGMDTAGKHEGRRTPGSGTFRCWWSGSAAQYTAPLAGGGAAGRSLKRAASALVSRTRMPVSSPTATNNAPKSR